MAIQTPAHGQRLAFGGEGHLINGTVTRRAAHAFADVNAVIEINVIGQIVHAIPVQRCVALGAQHDGLEHLSVGENLRMARHAGVRRGHAGER